MLARIEAADRTKLTDPRHYNIRWLELLSELKPQLERFADRPVVPRALITGGGGQLASDLQSCSATSRAPLARRARHRRPRRGRRARSPRPSRTLVLNCAAFHNVDVCEREPDRPGRSTCARCATWRALRRHDAKLVHLSTNYVFDGRRAEPYGEDDLPSPRSIYALTKLAGEHAALAYAPGALVVRDAGPLRARRQRVEGRQLRPAHDRRAPGAGRAARWSPTSACQPTFTADLAAAVLEAVERDADGVLHLDRRGACSWFEFTRGDHGDRRRRRADRARRDHVPPGGVDRPLNGVLAQRRGDALGLRRCALARGARGLHGPRRARRSARSANGSSSAISLSFGAVASRSEGISSSTGSGHSIADVGVVVGDPRSVSSRSSSTACT